MKKFTGRLRRGIPFVCLFLIPILNFYLMEGYTHNPMETMALRVHIMNILLFEAMALFLTAVTGRICAALLLQTVFCAVYGLANYYVLEFRGAPIQPWDILSISTAASVADNYEYRLDPAAIRILLGFLLLAAAEVLLYKSRIRRPKTDSRPVPDENFPPKHRIRTKKTAMRLILGLFTGLFLFGYTKMLHNEEIVQTKLRLYDKLFTPTTIQYKNGTVTAFLMELQYLSVDKPKNYSKAQAQQLLSSYRSDAPAPEEKPNIIVVMNEAFSDPAVLGDFTASTDYMPFVHSLLAGRENTISGNLSVSVKGGNTANTEFEYLTGHSMAFLPYGSIPYQQYIKDDQPSLASHLSSLGYHTVAMHPYRAGGWDRDTVYPHLGFDEMHFQEYYKDAGLVRKYVSDRGDYEKIIQVYENKPQGEPLFLFNVTMQNHSSYSDWGDYDNFSPDITVEGSDSKLLSAYLSLLKLSDTAIEELVNYFSAQEEKTVLVFFGDHQPTDSVVNPVLKLHQKNCETLSDAEKTLRYKVPFFIWANFPIGSQRGVETSANYLAAQTLTAAGLPQPAYFRFLTDLQTRIPVVCAGHVQLADGVLSDAKTQQDALHDYHTLQYYLLTDR